MPPQKTLIIMLLIALMGCDSSSNETEEADYPKQDFHNLVFLGSQPQEWEKMAPHDPHFSQQVQRKIVAEKLPFQVVNESDFAETSQRSLAKIGNILQNPVEILAILCCQADIDARIPIQESRQNIQTLIDLTLTKYPKSSIALVNTIDFEDDSRQLTKWARMMEEMAVTNNTAYIQLDLNKNVMTRGQLANSDGDGFLLEGVSRLWTGLRPLLY